MRENSRTLEFKSSQVFLRRPLFTHWRDLLIHMRLGTRSSLFQVMAWRWITGVIPSPEPMTTYCQLHLKQHIKKIYSKTLNLSFKKCIWLYCPQTRGHFVHVPFWQFWYQMYTQRCSYFRNFDDYIWYKVQPFATCMFSSGPQALWLKWLGISGLMKSLRYYNYATTTLRFVKPYFTNLCHSSSHITKSSL